MADNGEWGFDPRYRNDIIEAIRAHPDYRYTLPNYIELRQPPDGFPTEFGHEFNSTRREVSSDRPVAIARVGRDHIIPLHAESREVSQYHRGLMSRLDLIVRAIKLRDTPGAATH